MAENNNQNTTSSNDLARMIAGGFAKTNKKIDDFRKEVNERFEIVDSRLDAIERRLDALESVIAEMRKEIQGLHKESLQNELDIREIRLRVERLEKHLGLAK